LDNELPLTIFRLPAAAAAASPDLTEIPFTADVSAEPVRSEILPLLAAFSVEISIAPEATLFCALVASPISPEVNPPALVSRTAEPPELVALLPAETLMLAPAC
jgi:hypothetical protein